MDDIVIPDYYDSLCPHHGLFNITYSKEIVFTLTRAYTIDFQYFSLDLGK